MTAIKAHFDGKVFVPDEPVDFPVDRPIILHVEAVLPDASAAETARRLAEDPPWRDRTDIGDSLEYARQLRKQAETRHHDE
jgi:hypothetical protein